MTPRRLSTPMVVAATLVTVTTLLFGAFGAVDYVTRRNDEWARLRRVTAAQSSELAVALAAPVWNLDHPQIDRILDSQENANLVEGIVVRAAGPVHARVRDRRRRLIPSNGVFPTRGLLMEERPITFTGERIGTVRLYTTPQFIERDLRAVLMRTIVAILTVDLLLILSVYLVLWRTMLKPIVEIERYAAAVSEEGTTSAPSLRPAPTLELESLRVSIETMVRLLHDRITQRREMEEALRRSETMSAMGALVAGVAHEVRNPLFGMSALLDAYAEELTGPDLQELSSRLREQIGRLTQLMRELLEYGRPVQITPIPDSLPALVTEVMQSRQQEAAAAKVTLRETFDSSLPPTPMDRSRLRQVFENLIDNALQHSPAVRTITIGAHPIVHADRRWLECTVEDDGSGFQSADLERVFEPFFTRRERGIGLGMSIVQRIVEEHGGRVAAGNRAEGGAVISMRLPAV